MTDFKSHLVFIKSNERDIFAFLSNFNNFMKLMPEQVINWQSDENTCSFTIKGMADLSMSMDKKEEFRLISYVSGNKSPFAFHLNFDIANAGEGSSNVQASLLAQLNPMLTLMASRPLQNFVNLLVDKLKEVMEKG